MITNVLIKVNVIYYNVKYYPAVLLLSVLLKEVATSLKGQN